MLSYSRKIRLHTQHTDFSICIGSYRQTVDTNSHGWSRPNIAVVVVASSSSQDGHRHKVVVVMALMSLSLCVAVVVVVPLLSTIVFVGLLDVGCHHCLFVLLLSSSRHRRKMVVVMALLSLSLCVVVVVVVPLFVNHCFCWIVGFWPSSSSLCVAVVTPLLFLLLLLLLSVLGHHHCHSGLARFQLIFISRSISCAKIENSK